MRTSAEAIDKAAEMNSKLPFGDRRYYTVDQSPTTGAWRVIEVRQGYFQQVATS